MINQNSIDQYCSYFEEHLRKVSMVEELLYRKILLVIILDTLARARHPKINSNRDRFVNLIKNCADWADNDRISLPQLSLLLQISPGDGRLKREVDRKIGDWQHGRIYRLDIDPRPQELKPFITTENEQKLIDYSCHANLLYTYRNDLVHEFREPGYGLEISNDNTTPYYHGMTNLQGHDTWELVYPIGFFMYIVKCSLDSLKHYLKDNNLDPYSLYEFGSLWKHK